MSVIQKMSDPNAYPRLKKIAGIVIVVMVGCWLLLSTGVIVRAAANQFIDRRVAIGMDQLYAKIDFERQIAVRDAKLQAQASTTVAPTYQENTRENFVELIKNTPHPSANAAWKTYVTGGYQFSYPANWVPYHYTEIKGGRQFATFYDFNGNAMATLGCPSWELPPHDPSLSKTVLDVARAVSSPQGIQAEVGLVETIEGGEASDDSHNFKLSMTPVQPPGDISSCLITSSIIGAFPNLESIYKRMHGSVIVVKYTGVEIGD